MKRLSISHISLDNICFTYEEAAPVFTGLCHTFIPQDVLFLQGPRGSGKNTLLRLLLGLETPTSGRYLINGVVVNELGHDEFASYRLNFGYAPDVGGLINNHTLYENFKLLLDYHDVGDPKGRFDYISSLFERFDLGGIKHLRPAFVSSTARKAAAVLRAFALRPEVLILDNPGQGMSVEHIPVLVELIHEHRAHHGLKYVIISSDDVGLLGLLRGRIARVMPQELQMAPPLRSTG